MKLPEIPANEVERLQALKKLGLLDTPIQEPFERITRLAKKVFNVPIVSFTLIDAERQWFKSTQGLDICETDRGQSICAHAINQNDVFILNDTLLDERFRDHPAVVGDLGVRFYAGCPIRDKNGFNIGTLCVVDTKPREFGADDIDSLKDMAGLIENEINTNKVVIEQLKLTNELAQVKQSSMVDGLTRLWNRAAIENFLNKQIQLANSTQTNFGIAIVDIDNFKHINDTYGHLTGDAVLRQVAKQLLSGYRDSDKVGRWGGEEFLIVIDGPKTDKLCSIADRAREVVASAPLECGKNEIKVSVTTGVSCYDYRKPVEMATLISNADQALYQGKHAGKNIVIEKDGE